MPQAEVEKERRTRRRTLAKKQKRKKVSKLYNSVETPARRNISTT